MIGWCVWRMMPLPREILVKKVSRIWIQSHSENKKSERIINGSEKEMWAQRLTE
jgi:hypothetical protein